MNEEEKKTIANFKYWIDTNTEKGVCYIPDYICAKVLNLIEKLQKEYDFEYMKEKIEEQETKIRELTDKKNVIDLDYKEEYYKLQKENYELKKKIEAYQEALLNICSK